jgi:hypothetical protein
MVVYNYYMYKVISRDLQKIRNKNKNDINIIYIVKDDIRGEYLKFDWIWIV